MKRNGFTRESFFPLDGNGRSPSTMAAGIREHDATKSQLGRANAGVGDGRGRKCLNCGFLIIPRSDFVVAVPFWGGLRLPFWEMRYDGVELERGPAMVWCCL